MHRSPEADYREVAVEMRTQRTMRIKLLLVTTKWPAPNARGLGREDASGNPWFPFGEGIQRGKSGKSLLLPTPGLGRAMASLE